MRQMCKEPQSHMVITYQGHGRGATHTHTHGGATMTSYRVKYTTRTHECRLSTPNNCTSQHTPARCACFEPARGQRKMASSSSSQRHIETLNSTWPLEREEEGDAWSMLNYSGRTKESFLSSGHRGGCVTVNQACLINACVCVCLRYVMCSRAAAN